MLVDRQLALLGQRVEYRDVAQGASGHVVSSGRSLLERSPDVEDLDILFLHARCHS